MSFESTKNYKEYLQYKQLKSTLVCNYKGIDLIKALSVDIIEVFVCKHKKTIKNILVPLLRRLDIKPLHEALCQYKTVFTFDAPNRKDHWNLVTAMSKDVKDATVIPLHYHYIFWFNFGLWFKYFFSISCKIKTSFRNRLYLTARCLFFVRIIKNLNIYFSDNVYPSKIYVPFCSQTYTEACLTLFFKQKGLKTFNVFHGIFGRYKMFLTNDVANGENILAEHVLAFNETQKNDLIKYFGINTNRIAIAGNPKYPAKNISVKNSFKSAIILGGIYPYDSYLEQLLLLADKISQTEKISFSLKPHPLSKIETTETFQNCKRIQLINKTITLKQIFDSSNFDFAITHNTSTYYECMYYGLLPLRWGVGENLNFEGFDDKFYNIDSFLQIIERNKREDIQIMNQKIMRLLVRSYGMGINNYEQLIR
ncbi:MAG: hypothetical protein LBQ28_10570 [Prevotellaceae bacterium]|jgi:hypothetical protein|nr:hypothetical protein [Prevotellaceae bacterium]